jgi:hypothetical protein
MTAFHDSGHCCKPITLPILRWFLSRVLAPVWQNRRMAYPGGDRQTGESRPRPSFGPSAMRRSGPKNAPTRAFRSQAVIQRGSPHDQSQARFGGFALGRRTVGPNGTGASCRSIPTWSRGTFVSSIIIQASFTRFARENFVLASSNCPL